MKNASSPFVHLTLPCRDLAEMQRAKEAVLYHLETLNPEFSAHGNKLSVCVVPIDPTLFLPDEACEIIRQTLTPSLSFLSNWTCRLQAERQG